MSLPNQSVDKNKRYAGVKANDFVNKTRTNEASRATARTQGWANLGKASGRRVPPPANVPSLKSETGTNPPSFDPTIPTGTSHGWTASGNPTPANQTRPLTPSKQPTQQQIDSLPAHSSSTPPPSQTSADLEKPRLPATWNTVTAGNNPNGNPNDQPPNLLALNDFPRLATQENKSQKSPSDSLVGSISNNNQGPSFRPANLASWKEGGGRAQPISTDTSKDSNDNSLSMQSQVLNTNPNSLQTQLPNPSYVRIYQPPPQQQQQQMWSYNVPHSYGNNQPHTSMSMHHPQARQSSYGASNQSQNSQRMNNSTDYKTPTILRNKDIDDLSKLTDNVTWASASQEVNYEEKIRFSDDEDNETVDPKQKSRRFNQSRSNYPQVLQNNNRSSQTTRSRLLQDDEHVRQMQDDKNSELINALTVAKQRRDEQERHLRDQRSTTSNDQKQMPGYQTRPLITSTGQENLPSSQTDTSLWNQTSSVPTTVTRTRHDTADSQTFAMKSWSDQMDSFNYASLHEKSGGQADVDDDPPAASTNRTRKHSRSASESSSQSQADRNSTTHNRSKHFPLANRKANKSNVSQSRIKSKTTDVIDYFENNESQSKSNDQWGDWEESNYSSNNRYQQTYTNDRRRQQPSADDFSQKSNRYSEQTNDYNRTKQSTKTRSNASRSSDIPSTSTKAETKTQPAWRALSPTRPLDSNDPTPQEAITYKTQTKPTELNDRRQSAPIERKSRYNTTTTPINTASIPPLMSVRSDVPPPTVSSSANVANSKHFKTSNQSQRQDYNTSSHYSQRNDFYNETNDSAWGNDDDYYEDETGYYDPNLQTHQRHSQAMGYHTHSHHRGYTTLGSYGRYRRGGTLRHQQQYATYNTNNPSSASSQLNTSAGSKTKKSVVNRTTVPTSKKANESSEQIKTVEEPAKIVPDESVKKPLAWAIEPKPSVIEEIPIVKTVETPSIPTVIEKVKDLPLEQKPDNEFTALGQTDTDSISTNKKSSTTTSSQKKSSKDQQNYHPDQRYQNQQTLRHRNTYAHSTQDLDYEAMQMSSHHYFTANRRTTRGGRNARMHDLSSGYYYEHPQQRYNNQYNYSTDHYQQQNSSRSTNRTAKRGNSATATTDRSSSKGQTNTGNATVHHQSVSDNEQKEGEEWETASESSANMRNNHHESTQPTTTNETKPTNRDRTPPKKSFSSQRPLNSRHNENVIHRRGYNLYERGNKSTRGIRSSRLTTNQKAMSSHENDEDSLSNKQGKKDQHRHSLDGYDLNNVAGVVKIETLPAGALEEESTAFDDGGEEFCLVMSKRDRKEQKAAQLSKQNAVELPTDLPVKPASIEADDQPTNEKTSTDPNPSNSTRARTGKSLPPRFNSKSSARQTKTEHSNASMYYYDQNYYYYDQNQYYDHDGFYYNNYNQSSHRQPAATRRKPRNQQHPETNPPIEGRKIEVEKTSSNVMSNIQMWNPHTDNTMSNTSKLIEKPMHERKFASEIVPSSSNDAPLVLPLTTHSPVSKTNETLVRTIKPPMVDNKPERETKPKTSNYEKTNTISSLGSNQLFEKSTFLDYDDKQSIGTVGDDYNQKINSLKTIWDASDHASGQLEQTINTMVAMQQHQDNGVQSTNSNKAENYIQESIPTSSSGANTNVSSTANDDANNKNPSVNTNLQSTGSSSTINQSTTYSSNSNSNKNEAKNICTVKPTQQVPPNIQDQVDVTAYQTFPTPPLAPTMSQASLQQQHILPQSQVNPLHQQHTYPFYDTLLPPPPPPPQQQQAQQQQFSRIYSSTTNSTSTDTINSDFSSVQSSAIYPPQNFPYRNTNVYMQPPPPNTNSMYHHTSQAPPQNNAMAPPPPMPNYPSPFLVDPGGHMISQPQPPQAYMNNQMMAGRPQGGPYYRNPPQQQLQTPPGPPYGSQDPLAHGGYYPPFFQPNSNAPPVGHPSPHNLYGQNDGFHPPHPQMFARGGSIDRGDHPLMSQPLSRPTNYPSASSNPPPSGAPPSLLSQNLKSFHTNPQQTSSSNQAPFYPQPPPNQFNRQPMPIGAMNNTNNRQQTQQVPSLMSGLSKNFSSNGNNTQPLFSHRQPLLPPQSTNNRPVYPHHTQYSTYSKSTAPNDDNVKPKHI